MVNLYLPKQLPVRQIFIKGPKCVFYNKAFHRAMITSQPQYTNIYLQQLLNQGKLIQAFTQIGNFISSLWISLIVHTLLKRITTLARRVITLTKPQAVVTSGKCETTGLRLHHLQTQSGFTSRHGFNGDLYLKVCFKLRGMDCMACGKGWNQDSTSSQSRVHLGPPPKLCLDISLKARPP